MALDAHVAVELSAAVEQRRGLAAGQIVVAGRLEGGRVADVGQGDVRPGICKHPAERERVNLVVGAVIGDDQTCTCHCSSVLSRLSWCGRLPEPTDLVAATWRPRAPAGTLWRDLAIT